MREDEYAVKVEPLRLTEIHGVEAVAIRCYIQPQNLWVVIANVGVHLRVPNQENPIVRRSVVMARISARLLGEETVCEVSNLLIAPVGAVLIGEGDDPLLLPLPKLSNYAYP
jgi:hypothetical protein